MKVKSKEPKGDRRTPKTKEIIAKYKAGLRGYGTKYSMQGLSYEYHVGTSRIWRIIKKAQEKGEI